MDLARQLGESMGDVVALWAISGLGLTGLVALVLRRRRRLGWRRLATSDRGSYMVSLLMVLPTFITLLALFLQSTLLMVGKLGTVYAAYAASRTAAVWAATDAREAVIHAQVQLAAAKALAPFASGQEAAQCIADGELPAGVAEAFADAYLVVAEDEVADREMVAQRFRNAYGAVKVELTLHKGAAAASLILEQEQPEAVAVVKLSYESPLIVPGMGLVLGRLVNGVKGPFYARTIETTVAMAVERPRIHPEPDDRTHVMGIRYDEVH